jgi:uncharacterized protein DUF3987/bifunctional DNA primase/polymerase-like protein
MNNISTIRKRLRDSGYDPIPLRGKNPAMKKDWAWHKLAGASEDQIGMWAKSFPDADNTGIRCGKTPAFDIDILNPEAAQEVEELTRERFEDRGYFLTRIGRAPKRAVLFRTEEPFPKIVEKLIAPDGSEQKLELLADGQQLAAFGVHPDTRRPYTWHGGEPGDVRWGDLPYIRQEDARQLVDDAVAILIKHGYQHKTKPPKPTAPDGTQRTDWSWLLANVIDHDALTSLGAGLVSSGMHGGAAVNLMRALVNAAPGDPAEPFRKMRRLSEIPSIVSSGAEKFGTAQEQQPQPTELFDPWQRYAVPAFPLEILSPTIKHFVMTQAEIVGCDRSAMAMAVLAALSGALDHRFALKIMRHGSWWSSPRLWVLLVGDPSVKKTPIINSATDEIDRIQAARFRQYQNDKKEYVAAGGEPDKFRDPPDRYTAYDVTTEKLGIILAKQDRGILIKRDELSGWIGSMEKYSASSRGSSADRAFWLKSFDGGPFTVDRVSRADLQIQNLSASIIGGIQPARLAELHGLTSDGLLQRFLPVMAGHSTFPVDRNMTTEAEHYADLLRCLLGLAPQKLVLCDDAVALMEKLRRRLHDLEHASGGLADGFQGFVGKLAGIAGSLALILTITADPNRALGYQVPTSVIEDITRLVFDFIIPHAFEFYRTADRAGGGDRLQRVASWILTSGKQRILPSDLTVNVSDLRGLGLWDLNQRISPLVAGGWLTSQEPGPIAKVWTVNPKVHELFSARSREEEARKSTIAALMNSPRATKK